MLLQLESLMVLKVVNKLKKKLINLENISEFIKDKEFFKSKNMIISPNVNDYLKVKGIKIVNEKECLKSRIEKLLKTDFNIKDEVTLQKIIAKVEEAIKNGY